MGANGSQLVLDRGVADRPALIGTQCLAGLFQQRPVIALAQRQDVHAGPEALGFDLLGIQQPGKRVNRVRSRLRGLAEEVAASPQPSGLALRGWSMIGISDIRMLLRPDSVAGDDVATGQDVEAGTDDAHIHGGPDEGGGHRVFDGVDLNVPVPGGFRLLPAHVLPGLVGQADEIAGFTFGEPLAPGLRFAAKRGAVVDPLDPVGDGVAEVVDISEESVGEVVDDPVRDDLDAGFDVGFLLRSIGPGGYGCCVVVLEEPGVGDVDVAGFVVLADLVRRC